MKHIKLLPIIMLVLFLSLFTPITAHADIAPPEQPPGASIVPGGESTQVRMVAETVTLTVLPKPSANQLAQAATVADFTMRNLSAETETMQARFPLTFWNDRDDGFGKFPEISNIQIFVDGKQVSTHRIDANFSNAGGIAYQQAPWAAFDVSFPPATDVKITVKYTTNGYGYADGPNAVFRYVLETGAGWNGTIGSADVIIKLPYPATEENAPDAESMGFGRTTPGMQRIDDTVRWHFEDFEPTADDNILVVLVIPAFWQKVLNWRAQTQKTPNDGEAWGQLGKAIKEAIRAAKGYPRDDAAAQKAYGEAIQAYEKAVTLLPKDALWHYGFADMLWDNYYFLNRAKPGISEVSRIADELRLSLALSPKNQKAIDLADWVAQEYPWAIAKTDDGYDYPVLTATPTANPSTETPSPEATSTPQLRMVPTLTAVPTGADTPVSPAKTPKAGLPLCGGAGLVMFPALAAFWLCKRSKHATHL